VFAPGFFSSGSVHTALLLGTIVAIVSGLMGVFVLLRNQSFGGHALTDVATTGGAGAAYLSVAPLVGFVTGAVIGAGAIESLSRDHSQRRDVATGIVLGAATGLSGLFLYLTATTSSATGVTQQVLFGSLFSVSSSTVPVAAVTALIVTVTMALVARPLLLSSLSPDLARARGLRTSWLGLLFLLLVAVAVGLCAISIGSLLATALLIGPAATAMRRSRTITGAIVMAMSVGLAATWVGIVLAYDSFTWRATGQGLPVSFFVVATILAFYALSHVPLSRSRRV